MRRQPVDRPGGAVSYQVVCLSCGYCSAWPTRLDAHADGHRHDAEHATPGAMPALRAPLPPTQQTGGDANTRP